MSKEQFTLILKYLEEGYDSLRKFDHKILGLDPFKRALEGTERAFAKRAAKVLREHLADNL